MVRNNNITTNGNDEEITNDEESTREKLSIPVMSDDKAQTMKKKPMMKKMLSQVKICQRQTQN